MNHRNINATLRYYRIGEDRRRDAVDKVTAMAFDRHGNRIWRDVRDLLDAEHARYAISEVAAPYGLQLLAARSSSSLRDASTSASAR
jgi:hypothetical protein